MSSELLLVACGCQSLTCADNTSVCVGVHQSTGIESWSTLVVSSGSCVERTAPEVSASER